MQAEQSMLPSDSLFSWDTFLMGGCSILVCIGFWAFVDRNVSLLAISNVAFTMAFVVNHPHFLSSYMLLYGDFGKEIFLKKRYFWAAIIVPTILITALASALINKNATLIGHMVSLMFLSVGWHYVKQIFGCVIVTSAQRKIYYTVWERRFLLSNLFAVWFMSWLRSQTGSVQTFEYYGIPYSGLGLPGWILSFCYFAVLVTLGLNIVLHFRKFIHEGKKPSVPGLVAFTSLYVWYLPALSHPGFSYLIPFFHSLQYLAFVWSLKKNQVQFEIQSLKGRDQRVQWLRRFVGFVFTALTLGALSFEFIPKSLDAAKLIEQGTMGSAPFLAATLLFINIHHYFIDNVIWRSDNEVVKKFLFRPLNRTGQAI
jgi:hypothetical protein